MKVKDIAVKKLSFLKVFNFQNYKHSIKFTLYLFIFCTKSGVTLCTEVKLAIAVAALYLKAILTAIKKEILDSFFSLTQSKCTTNIFYVNHKKANYESTSLSWSKGCPNRR
jgi:hypothetical protein